MISLVVVNYRTASLTIDAIRTARAACSEPLQTVVVDNSCDPSEAAALAGVGDILLISRSNRGYAGGINDGREHCTADVIIAANPDVKFGPHSIDLLAAAIRGGASAAGPALFWDSSYEWHLPPAELHTTAEVVRGALAARSRRWTRSRDVQGFRKRLAFWMLASTTPVDALSGAIMALRAADLDRLGGFDERFALYFEETDLLRRMKNASMRILYVPQASCQHLYNQSAGAAGVASGEAYAESERRYLEKWSGSVTPRLVLRMRREPLAEHAAEVGAAFEVPEGAVVEASPLASFETAAAAFPRGGIFEFPEDIWQTYRATELFFALRERRTGRRLATYVRRRRGVESPA